MNVHEKSVLDLSHNQLLGFIHHDETVMRNLRLTKLNLSHNRLTFLSPIIFMDTLTDLNVSHNDLCMLPKELSKMNGLQKLDVSFNPNLFYLPKVNISEYISRMI